MRVLAVLLLANRRSLVSEVSAPAAGQVIIPRLAYSASIGLYSALPLANNARALRPLGTETRSRPFFAMARQPCSNIFLDFGQSYGAVSL